MGESLTERRHVNDEGLRVVKFCQGGRWLIFGLIDGTLRGSSGQLRASSRGNT